MSRPEVSKQKSAKKLDSPEPMVKQTTVKEGRKQLPSIPDPETQAAMMPSNHKNTPLTKGNNGYGMFFLEYSLMAEYNQLYKQKLPGVYVMPSATSPLVWFGMLFIRQGLYQEGVFRFKLLIPENYPDGDCPQLVFDFPVFHPLVNPETGELDVKRAFSKWRRNVNHIWQVLLYARRIFYKIDTKSPWNPEAAVLYEQDLEHFKRRIAETVVTSKEKIYHSSEGDDPHALRFSPWDPSVHGDTRSQMLEPKDDPADEEERTTSCPEGLSWMSSGNAQIFSREDSALA